MSRIPRKQMLFKLLLSSLLVLLPAAAVFTLLFLVYPFGGWWVRLVHHLISLRYADSLLAIIKIIIMIFRNPHQQQQQQRWCQMKWSGWGRISDRQTNGNYNKRDVNETRLRAFLCLLSINFIIRVFHPGSPGSRFVYRLTSYSIANNSLDVAKVCAGPPSLEWKIQTRRTF